MKNKTIIIIIIAVIILASLIYIFPKYVFKQQSIIGWQEGGDYSELAQNSVIYDQRNCGNYGCDSDDSKVQQSKMDVWLLEGYSSCDIFPTSDYKGNGRLVAYCTECPINKFKIKGDLTHLGSCIIKECDSGTQIKTCKDGSEITTHICENNLWKPTSYVCCENDEVKYCEDSKTVEFKCEDNDWTRISECKKSYLWLYITGAILLIIIISIIVWKKR